MITNFQVQRVFNADVNKWVFELSRKDNGLLDSDGAIAYNYDNADDAVTGMYKVARRLGANMVVNYPMHPGSIHFDLVR